MTLSRSRDDIGGKQNEGRCLCQVLAIIGLRAKEKLVRDNVAIIAANLALAREFFAKHSATFAFSEPKAGSIAFARLTTGEPIQQFCQRLVKEAGHKPASQPCALSTKRLEAAHVHFHILRDHVFLYW